MQRRTFMLGAIALLAVIFSALPQERAQAQCCRVGFRLAGDICPVTLCIITPDGRRCYTLDPGIDSVVAIPCDVAIRVGLLDGCGNPHVVLPDSCEDNILISHTCCVKVCLRRDPNTGCFRVTVEPATGPCTCP